MSNELPQAPTQMCEPVYIGTSNIGNRVSTKKYKQSWHVFFGYYRFGRIKRMRNPIPKHRWPTLTKRIGCQRTFLIATFPNDVFTKALFGITRWNRH